MTRPLPHSSRALRCLRQLAIATALASVPVVVFGQNSSSESAEVVRDPRPFAALSATAVSMLRRDSIVAVARSQIGTRYRWGGTTPKGGFDCSGFVRYVLSAFQLALPRTAAQQAKQGETVPKDTTRLLPGDLLTFGRGNKVTHIGIYVGNGHYVHASPKAGRVIETSLDRSESSLVKIWRGGVRVLAGLDAVEATDTSAFIAP
jgi:cell wall-associated NlpC family hydrolase